MPSKLLHHKSYAIGLAELTPLHNFRLTASTGSDLGISGGAPSPAVDSLHTRSLILTVPGPVRLEELQLHSSW